MRFSVATALCAAPLALAGTLYQDLVARGAIGLEVGARSEQSQGESKGNSNSQKQEQGKQQKNNDKGGNNGNGNNVVLVQQSTINEVIIIWVNNGGGAATSTVTDTVTVTQGGGGANTAGGVAAAVATHQVTVGGTAGLVYSPEQISANVGDMVIFTFLSNNHTVTQSGFTEPCKKLPEGMDSGFMTNINNTVSPPPQMAMQVTVATPIWFYCRQKAHCGKGMTFSINPTAEKTQAMFKQMAIAQNGTGVASPITGGAPAGAPAPPAAPPAAETTAAAPPPPAETAAAAPSGVQTGTGTLNNGACECACLCAVGSFPDSALQGLGAFGGLPGQMPVRMLEV